MAIIKTVKIWHGIIWGLAMFICAEIIWPLITNESIVFRSMLLSLPMWIIMGLVFGYLMKVFTFGTTLNEK
jgi:uncharacterized membrane protein